jgi:hypothetical protein
MLQASSSRRTLPQCAREATVDVVRTVVTSLDDKGVSLAARNRGRECAAGRGQGSAVGHVIGCGDRVVLVQKATAILQSPSREMGQHPKVTSASSWAQPLPLH